MTVLWLVVIALVLIIALSIVLAVRSYQQTPDDPPAVTHPLQKMGLEYANGVFQGTIRDCLVSVTLPNTSTQRLEIEVQTRKPINGEVRLTGPSANATSGAPEAKIRIGDNAFDERFWIVRSQPRDMAEQLLMPHDMLRRRMLGVPFGQWNIAGKSIRYRTHADKIREHETLVPVLVTLLVDMANLLP